ENRCLNDMIESQVLSLQNGSDVVEYAPGLGGDVARNNLTRFGVEWNLPAAKQEASATHRLRIGTNRPRSFACRNDFLHTAILNTDARRAIMVMPQPAVFADRVCGEIPSRFRSDNDCSRPDRQKRSCHH